MVTLKKHKCKWRYDGIKNMARTCVFCHTHQYYIFFKDIGWFNVDCKEYKRRLDEEPYEVKRDELEKQEKERMFQACEYK